MATEGRSPSQIERLLVVDERKISPTERVCDRVPHIRTIERIVARVTPRDDSGRWTFGSGENDRALLDIAVAVIECTEGRVAWLTSAEAAEIARLLPVVPGLEAWETFVLARTYLLRRSLSEPADDLDQIVAFAPWQSDDASTRYFEAVMSRRIAQVDASDHFLPLVLMKSDGRGGQEVLERVASSLEVWKEEAESYEGKSALWASWIVQQRMAKTVGGKVDESGGAK